MLTSKLLPHVRWLAPLAAAGLGVFLAPPPSVVKPSNNMATNFNLPAEVLPRNYEPRLAELDGRNLWGNVRSPNEPQALVDPRWWLSGTGGVGKDRFVIMEREGSPAEFLKVGNSLPGQAKILEIQDDVLCILIDGKKRKLPVLSK